MVFVLLGEFPLSKYYFYLAAPEMVQTELARFSLS